MRDFLRFMFSAADRDRIDPGSIIVEDTTVPPADQEGVPLQSMKISGTVIDPTAPAPQLRPLFPGETRFLAKAAMAANLPDWSDVDLTTATYNSWQTNGILEGTLRVIDQLPDVKKGLDEQGASLQEVPNIAWYSPVILSENFLYNTVANPPLSTRKKIKGPNSPVAVLPGSSNWPKHAVAWFLQGLYPHILRLGADATQDDIIRLDMPTIKMAADGSFDLYITMARSQPASDRKSHLFDDASPGIGRLWAAHSMNGIIPARHVYRELRNNLLDANLSHAVVDAILIDWPNARRYQPVRFTRTWLQTLASGKKVKNCSVYFPKQKIKVRNLADDSIRLEREIPAHGVVYVPVEPGETGANQPQVLIEISGNMKWLDGSTPNSWQFKGDTTPLLYHLETDQPHIILRLPMSQAMFEEPQPIKAPKGPRCTYLSFRRTVRALVDNRIAGGRLNRKPGKTSRPVRALITEAFGETGLSPANRRVRVIVKGRPPVAATDLNAAEKLRRVLQPFFTAPAVAASAPGKDLTVADVGYYIWLSSVTIASHADTSPYFVNNVHFGRGGAGALVYLGLADGYAFDSNQLPSEIGNTVDDALGYYYRLATAMRDNLIEGAALQFWDESAQFEEVKQRRQPCPGEWCGHSLLFHSYKTSGGVRTGVNLVDQYSKRKKIQTSPFSGPDNNRRLKWDDFGANIWCAANWKE
ncbi:MAG: hypothetical protein OEV80_07000 [candidate division Zixibacteria bacterium]|nr:hypothetical protein [candidate division Zixibacteria bacterium]